LNTFLAALAATSTPQSLSREASKPPPSAVRTCTSLSTCARTPS
jgi:hypothetical protein